MRQDCVSHAVHISYYLHNVSMKEELSLVSRSGNKGSETLSNLFKNTQLVNSKDFESRSF